ncbi:MAG: hypothetical protein R3308_01320 [Thiohalobacterales bacterium]|nr:hypothetical protein [Thiohalobacterales bacterium]
MKSLPVTMAVSLALFASGSAQAFCFLKNNGRDRPNDHYQYRMPAGAYMQPQVHYYPAGMMTVPAWRDRGIPAIMPEPVDADRYEGGSYRR